MMFGRLPGLALDRTGVALLGAIALLALGKLSLAEAVASVDIPTIALLFGLMVLSAQFRLGGFYSRTARALGQRESSPEMLLALLIVSSGVLSAVLANDIVCLAMTPVMAEGCLRRGLNPKPFLLALACAANVGSAATLIGNPQNMLIGQSLQLDFLTYVWQAGPPSAVGLAIVWFIIARQTRGHWYTNSRDLTVESPPYNSWETTKGMVILVLVLAAFIAAPWPRDLVALAAAGALLCSRRMRSRDMLGLVDWQLILLFISLFAVNHALAESGALASITAGLSAWRIDISSPIWLFGLSTVLSNLVSNVPAVMLLLPSATHSLAGPVLALSSTLAGNLIVVGSIANIIVIDQAARQGISIGWKEHARTGVPVTLATLAAAAAWLLFVAV